MKIGACWKKVMKDNRAYLSGILEIDKMPKSGKINIAIFPVKEKKNEKSPDFEIVFNDKSDTKSDTKSTDSIPF